MKYCLMTFERFKSEILALAKSSPTIESINDLVREFYIDKAISVVVTKPPFICRARLNFNGELFRSKNQLSYNPNADKVDMLRANFAKQQVFYAAVPTENEFGSCQNTATLETVMEHVKDETIMRQYLTLSRWKVIRPLYVGILPFAKVSYSQNGDFLKANEAYADLMKKNKVLKDINVEKKKEYLEALEFMSEVFCKQENKSFYYKISSCYYNMIMEYSEANGVILDGLLYPSANTGAAGINIVLSKKSIDDESVVFDYVVMMAMQRHPGNPKDITFINVADEVIPDKNGNFHFSVVL